MFMPNMIKRILMPDPVVTCVYGGQRITKSGRVLPPTKKFLTLRKKYREMYYGKDINTSSHLFGFLGKFSKSLNKKSSDQIHASNNFM